MSGRLNRYSSVSGTRSAMIRIPFFSNTFRLRTLKSVLKLACEGKDSLKEIENQG